jgi:tRNA(Ile)-lysidine synthase
LVSLKTLVTKNKVTESLGDNLRVVLASRLQALQAQHSVSSIAVALSGGRDSMALLHALSRCQADNQFRLCAFSIDHRLQTPSSQWIEFCRSYCLQEKIQFYSCAVDVTDIAKLGVEAAARAARYQALVQLAKQHQVDCIALGHHSDDQAETVLLQMARGAGVAGLAAMPELALRQGVIWWRPMLLAVDRAAINKYVLHNNIAYVDDPSNTDQKLKRNALRASVLPALELQFPGVAKKLVELSLEAARLLEQQQVRAQTAWQALVDPATPHKMARAGLSQLSQSDQALLLRHWCKHLHLRMPSRARLEQIRKQLLGSGWPCIKHEGWLFEISPDRQFVQSRQAPILDAASDAQSNRPPAVRWREAVADEPGVVATLVDAGALTVMPRQGSELIQLHAKRHRRSIKQWCQERRVPLAQRANMQVVWHGHYVVWVSGLGLDQRYAVTSGLRWVPYVV